MAKIIKLESYIDERGSLTVIEKILPFEIKRVFYIYKVNNSIRGNHRHKKTVQAAISIQGSCIISNQSGINYPVDEILMDTPSKCIILYPEDYHWMDNFSDDCILMVLASELYDPDDYIFEPYK
jgi:dTDP-4-dehydrorhamnose 3,5-epimerase-like enzyme